MQRFIYILGVIVLSSTYLFAQSATWQRTGLRGGDVEALLRMDSGSMFAATRVGGLYRSTDDGTTWTHLPESKPASFLFNTAWCLAQGSGGELLVGTNYGLYRTTDEGGSWTVHDEGLTTKRIVTLLPAGNGMLFAGTYDGGIFRSSDNGETWTETNKGIENLSVNDMDMDHVGGLYTCTEDGIFRSTDNGVNWASINQGLENTSVLSLFVTPGDTILAGTRNGGYVSTDYGATWKRGTSFGAFYSVIVHPDGNFYAGGNTGFVFSSTDRGLVWGVATKLDHAFFNELHLTSSGDLMAATGNFGVVVSTDDGVTWKEQNAGVSANEVVDLLHTDAGMYAATSEGMYLSTDGGTTWARTLDDAAGVNIRAFGASPTGRLFMSSSGMTAMSDDDGASWYYADSSLTERWGDSFGFGPGNTVYAGFYGTIFRSNDNGDSWTALQGTITDARIQVIFVTPNGSIIVGTRDHGLQRSTDDGVSFTRVPSAGWDYDDHKAIILDDNGDLLLGSFNGVFRSTDEGVSWTMLGMPPTYGVKDLVRDSGGNLFIAMRGGGVAVSLDDGLTWKTINDELANLNATSLLFDEQGNLFVGTGGGGVFVSRPSTTEVDHHSISNPGTVELQQNYPNPFNPTTTIPFTLASPADVSLTVHDVLGRHVATLAQKQFGAGSHRVRFEARELAGGMYTVRLTVDGSVNTVRMLLLR